MFPNAHLPRTIWPFPLFPSSTLVLLGRKHKCVLQMGAAVAGRIAGSGLPAVSVAWRSFLVEVEEREKFSGWLSCSLT